VQVFFLFTEDLHVIATRPTPTYAANVKALFDAKCAVCHNAVASGGLIVTSFETLMKGDKDGVVIIPGAPDNSLLIQMQSKQHFANFSAEELEFIKQWITAGAPEK